MEELRATLSSIGLILSAMAALALVESRDPAPRARALAPRASRAQPRTHRDHLRDQRAPERRAGGRARGGRGARRRPPARARAPPPGRARPPCCSCSTSRSTSRTVAMHKLPALWRFHRVHHSDPLVDVTTTIRQHPGESLIRYAFTRRVRAPARREPRRLRALPRRGRALGPARARERARAARARPRALARRHLADAAQGPPLARPPSHRHELRQPRLVVGPAVRDLHAPRTRERTSPTGSTAATTRRSRRRPGSSPSRSAAKARAKLWEAGAP